MISCIGNSRQPIEKDEPQDGFQDISESIIERNPEETFINNVFITHIPKPGNSNMEVEITGYKGTAQDIRIPEKIGRYFVIGITNGAFLRKQLTSVTFPNGLKVLGMFAFSENQITSVVIPDGIETLGDGVFWKNRLTTVTIPGNITLGLGSFQGNSITRITIGANVKKAPPWRDWEYRIFDDNFDDFYFDNGSKAGTYVLRDGLWHME